MPNQDAAAFRSALLGSGSLPVAARVASACQQLQLQGVPVTQLPCWSSLSMESVAKAQRVFSRTCSSCLCNELLSSSSSECQARLRSCSGVGSGAFVVCAPSETDGTELLDAVFIHAVKWRLGLPVCASGLFCNRVYSQDARRQCRCALDRYGDHLVCCGVGGFKTFLTPALW